MTKINNTANVSSILKLLPVEAEPPSWRRRPKRAKLRTDFTILAQETPESREMEEGRPAPTRPRECGRAVPAAAKG